jgi:hypothetical protein
MIMQPGFHSNPNPNPIGIIWFLVETSIYGCGPAAPLVAAPAHTACSCHAATACAPSTCALIASVLQRVVIGNACCSVLSWAPLLLDAWVMLRQPVPRSRALTARIPQRALLGAAAAGRHDLRQLQRHQPQGRQLRAPDQRGAGMPRRVPARLALGRSPVTRSMRKPLGAVGCVSECAGCGLHVAFLGVPVCPSMQSAR